MKPHDRPGTPSDAVADIFIDRLPADEIRRRWKAGRYGTPPPSPTHMAGWLKLRG
jgi:hypothetical protein